MPINYKDINELTEETNIAGTEKVPVSGTKYVLFNKIKDWIVNSLKTTGLNLGGNKIKNAGFEVVTSLPTTNNFVGRRVTFNNKDYIWDGTEWESNRNWLSVYIDGATPYMYAKLFTVNNPFQNIELNLRPYTYATDNPSSVNYLISFAYNRVVINKLFSNSIPHSGNYHYNLHFKKLTTSIFEIYVGMPCSTAYRNNLYADITNVRNSIVSSVELFQTLDTSDTNVWTSLLYDDLYFTEFHSLKTNRLKVNGASISDETINFDTNNIEPTQSGTVTKTSTWLWQYLTQSVNFLWLKLKDLFPTTQATTHNYLPKIDNANKKLVKSNIYDDGTTPKYGANTIWHSGNDGSNSGLDADLLDGIDSTGFQKVKIAYLNKAIIAPTSGTFWICIGTLSTFRTATITNLIIESTNSSDSPRLLDLSIITAYSIGAVKLIQNIGISHSGNMSTWGGYKLLITSDGKVWLYYVGSTQNFNLKLTAKSTTNTFVFATTFEVVYIEPINIISSLTFNDQLIIANDLKITTNGFVKFNSSDSYLLLGGGGEKPISDFATSTHNHDSAYLGITEKASDSDKLDGYHASDFATSNHDHDSTYLGLTATATDSDKLGGKPANEFITPADFETNQLYTPTLNPTWTILKSNNSPSGIVVTTSTITLEYGYKPSATVRAKWTQPSGYNTPESCDGLCGSNLPAINTLTSPAANIPYATYFDPVSPIVPSKSVTVWTIYANKKGITVSGNRLIMPEGKVSANALLSVIYQLPIYYGVVITNSMTATIIKALTSSMKNCTTSSKTFSPNINATDLQYWVYAYPSAWGVLTNISNADGDWKAAFTTGLINILSSNTLLTTEYRYYITVNRGAFKNKILNFS